MGCCFVEQVLISLSVEGYYVGLNTTVFLDNFMLVTMKYVVFWDMSCGSSEKNQRFRGGTSSLQAGKTQSLGGYTFLHNGTSVHLTRATWYHIPEDNILHCYCYENISGDRSLQSYIVHHVVLSAHCSLCSEGKSSGILLITCQWILNGTLVCPSSQ
jgi:acyl-[acyl carrier protein]--UDP-N-acetylglucosamine O-acyltransferase